MDEVLIENWNSIVNSGDVVYHLGDFMVWRKTSAERQRQRIVNLTKRLNGNIHLIMGNHDEMKIVKFGSFIKIHTFGHEIKIDGQKIVLCHYAMRVWNKAHWGAWMLHGHSHGNLEEQSHCSFDVGVDSWDYTPVSFEQVKEKMCNKDFVQVDHHKVGMKETEEPEKSEESPLQTG